MMVGATLIGMHSEPRYQGYNVFDKVIEGIKVFLERKGYESPKDIIGKVEIPLGIPSDLMEHVVPKEDVLINVDKSKCTGCGNCLKTCVFNAISINHDDIAEINLDKCVRCGSCAVVCPEKAIALRMAK
jgi:heterodisulfide reductase subunit A-like polyferredoxin